MTAVTRVGFRSVGLDVAVLTSAPWWLRFVREACAGRQRAVCSEQVRVIIEGGRQAFSHVGLQPLTRGAWSDGTTVVMEDACASGADLMLRRDDGCLETRVRYRPGWSSRALAAAAPARHVLLLRAAVLQYPAMWWAGVSGGVPLHLSAVSVRGVGVALAGPGGVGKSTLVHDALGRDGRGTSDNLCVGADRTLYGLLEPLRVESGGGRRMPHGRREMPWAERCDAVQVDRVLVLRRGTGATAAAASVVPMESAAAARSVVGGTYAAGELRRYWAFAATLALGTGLGPPHPPVREVASRLCESVPCFGADLPAVVGTRLDHLVDAEATGPLPGGGRS